MLWHHGCKILIWSLIQDEDWNFVCNKLENCSDIISMDYYFKLINISLGYLLILETINKSKYISYSLYAPCKYQGKLEVFQLFYSI